MCICMDTTVTGYWRCASFSVTLQCEISAGSQGSRSSLHFLNWQLEKLYSTGHDKRRGRQRSASWKRERSDKWGRLGGIRADESCWALRNDWQLIMKIWEGSLPHSAKAFAVVFSFPPTCGSHFYPSVIPSKSVSLRWTLVTVSCPHPPSLLVASVYIVFTELQCKSAIRVF